MGKRQKTDQLTKEDLEGDSDNQEQFQESLGDKQDIQTSDQIANRKIRQIKRRVPPSAGAPANNDKEDEQPKKTGFSLAVPLPKAKEPEQKPTGSLFNFSAPAKDPTKQTSLGIFAPPKEGDKKPSFGNGGSLFGGNADKKTTGLFGQTTASTSLFGTSPSTGLFGGKPTGGSLFGAPPKDGEAKPSLFGNSNPKSLFGNGNSLFGGQTNIFASKATNEKEANQEGDQSGDDYKNEDEPPTVTLKEYVGTKSPYEKIIEFQVQKFKIATPIEKKKNCGIGKTSIQKGVFNEKSVWKVIHKNMIGKILYDASITLNSKMRAVEEKAHRNQIKVALCYVDAETKKPQNQFCLINFQSKQDMESFQKEFQTAVDDKKSQK